jgi:hypothetical protein
MVTLEQAGKYRISEQMRKIKFRAWDTTYKKMVHLYVARLWKLFITFDGVIGGFEDDDEYKDCAIYGDRFTPMQFIGLHDKNGKEIYEGDIVAKFDFEAQHLRSVVIRHLGAFGYMNLGDFIVFASNYHFEWNDKGQSDKILVIGNIHDDPESIPQEVGTCK